MVEGTAKLVIDLGNSETRVRTFFGRKINGELKFRKSTLDNTYADISERDLPMYLDGDVYSEDSSRIFKTDSFLPESIILCNGEICNSEMGQFAARPSAKEKKYNSDLTMYAVYNALRQGIEDVADIANCDVSSVDVSWDVFVLLPPGDVEVGAPILANKISALNRLDFLMPDIHKDIQINHVTVFPEGFCAYIGILFESKGHMRPEMSGLVSEDNTTLIIDIGAGTTDIVLAKGSKIIKMSRFSSEIGGNNVDQAIKLDFRKQGINFTDEAMRRGTRVGYVMNGSKRVNILREISDAKGRVSKQLVSEIKSFLEGTSYPISSINSLLVCGGGAEKSEVEGIFPLSQYVISYIKKLNRDIEVIEYPLVVEDGVEKEISPRLLNIIGASILAA